MLEIASYRAWAAIAVVFATAMAAFAGHSADNNSSSMRYAPPDAAFTAGNQLQLLQDEINQKQFPAAANRLESLLRDSGDMLIAGSEEATVLSVSAWVANLPGDTRNLLRPAYETVAGAAAEQAVEQARARPDAQPADFYSLARRYPLAHAALAALAEGARRSALLGDVPAAKWMLKEATAGGWQADSALARELDQPSQQSAGFAGPVPFQASWYGARTRQAWGALRSFPWAIGGAIGGAAGEAEGGAEGNRFFIVGPERVIALKGNGRVEWTGPASVNMAGGSGAMAAIGVMRGSPFSPAVLCDAAGSPQLLVVRQPESHGAGWALRALRAEDGRLLWTTEGQDAYQGLVFGSNAVVEGRYVYAVAGEMTDQLDHLWLVALEVTTGRQLWRCDMGTQSRTVVQRPRNQPMQAFRPWMNESAPAVAGDLVIAAPNVGAVIAVGRFDGKLRWTRGYRSLPDPTIPLQRQRDFALAHPTSIPPLAPGLSLRWSNTPAVGGETVAAAPEDSDQVVGLAIADGKPLWQSDELPEATLVGIAGQTAVFAGAKVSGIDLGSGKTTWTYEDQAVQGPPVVRSNMVLVPTAADVVALSADSGTVIPSTEKVPDFERVIGVDAAHEALVANDLAHCFGIAVNRRERR